MKVALTFDAEFQDHPPGRPENIEHILRILGETPATFFIQGRWAQGHPGYAEAIKEAGHSIGSHGYYHIPAQLLGSRALHLDLTNAADAIYHTTGVYPRLYRPPWGRLTQTLNDILAERGYTRILWDVDSRDYKEDAETVVRNVVGGCTPSPLERMPLDSEQDVTKVVLFHSWPDATVQALPEILSHFASPDWELVAL